MMMMMMVGFRFQNSFALQKGFHQWHEVALSAD